MLPSRLLLILVTVEAKYVQAARPDRANVAYGTPSEGKPTIRPKIVAKISERLDQNPGNTDGGLLVPDLHIAPREIKQELAKCPQLGDVEEAQPVRGMDPHHRF